MPAENDEHNSESYREMVKSLNKLYLERVASGKPGRFGVHVTFRRGKLGEIHEVNETVKSIKGTVSE